MSYQEKTTEGTEGGNKKFKNKKVALLNYVPCNECMLFEKSLLSKRKKIKDGSKKTINLQKFKGAESHLDTKEKNVILAHSQADI